MGAEVAGGWFSLRDDNRSSAGGALILHITCTSIDINLAFICIREREYIVGSSFNRLWVSTLLLGLLWLYLQDYH